jgi:tRNA G37 N-methylase TrmD
MMKIDVLTLFPPMFEAPFSILSAIDNGLVEVKSPIFVTTRMTSTTSG